MTVRIAVTEGTLRRAIRDDLYRRAGDPERNPYVDWVSEGFRALE